MSKALEVLVERFQQRTEAKTVAESYPVYGYVTLNTYEGGTLGWRLRETSGRSLSGIEHGFKVLVHRPGKAVVEVCIPRRGRAILHRRRNGHDDRGRHFRGAHVLVS
jgi:hypothetical protein